MMIKKSKNLFMFNNFLQWSTVRMQKWQDKESKCCVIQFTRANNFQSDFTVKYFFKNLFFKLLKCVLYPFENNKNYFF